MARKPPKGLKYLNLIIRAIALTRLSSSLAPSLCTTLHEIPALVEVVLLLSLVVGSTVWS
ncbi:hypothetical protein TorRG33x02_044560 [Trema orientale]|uniref:Uncharacterized protein n=1 Tax=Trema orientale TaxID=63057 RepID=A0A2P5FPG1_TREOI|nr:hypothetical protein TorRG33x02_044560 [Trema orientale]